MLKLIAANRLVAAKNIPNYIRYLDDFPAIALNNIWTDSISGFMSDKVYVVQSTTKVVQRCLLMTTDPGDLVLDPTCGGGTTAIVAEQWGRRWITCDTSRVALALTRSRLMGARFPNYLLSDSNEGKKKEEELLGVPQDKSGVANDVRKGFVYKRIPHVTLKSIAKNPFITENMDSKALAQAILRGSDAEILYDQAHEGSSSVRVCGPFSVESLSPHRVLSTSDENLNGTVSEREAKEQQDFASMILANLKSAGYKTPRVLEESIFLHSSHSQVFGLMLQELTKIPREVSEGLQSRLDQNMEQLGQIKLKKPLKRQFKASDLIYSLYVGLLLTHT